MVERYRLIRNVGFVLYTSLLWTSAVLALVAAYRQRQAWVMGDWLIHYASGFVRRGLLGQILIMLSRATGLKPGVFVVLTILSVYAGFLFWAMRALQQQPRIMPFLLALMAPFLFLYPLWQWQGAYRKEILLFALYAWLVQSVARAPDTVFPRTAFALTLLPLILLSHEGLMAWAPFLLVPLFVHRPKPKQWPARWRYSLFVLVGINLVAWLVALAARGTPEQSQAIRQALKAMHYDIPAPGAIVWLAKPAAPLITKQCTRWIHEGWRWLGLLALVSIAYLPLGPRLARFWRVRGIRALWLLSAGMMLGLMCVALDWGRFVHIYGMMLFLSLLSVRDEHDIPWQVQPSTLNHVYIIFSFTYGLTWPWHVIAGFTRWRFPLETIYRLWMNHSDLAKELWHWLPVVWSVLAKLLP
ncbi:MAG: hypothetical protein GXO54_05840 [Chloroflexi bacterium]|nr:hypothetical protein [Chloroflexota bacterium]